MKVTIAFLLVSLCMDLCLSQAKLSTEVSQSPTNNRPAIITRASITSPASGNTTTPASGNTTTPASGNTTTPASDNTTTPASGNTTKPASGSTITPASGSTITTTSASRGSSSSCMLPFLAVLSVVGFLLL